MANIQEYIDKLRTKIADIIETLETWATLNQVSEDLGLSIYDNQGLGKHRYLQSVTERTSGSQIIIAARKILDGNYPGNRTKPRDSDLEDIQELIWWIDSQGEQKISHVTRHRILDALEGFPFWGRSSVSSFFHSVNIHSDFGSMPSVGKDGKLYRGLEWNFVSILTGTKSENSIPPVEISNSELFQDLSCLDWSDNKFCRVLERMLHPEVQPEKMQHRLHTIIRPLLNIDGFDIEVINSQGGYPVYGICRRNLGVSGSPKYLIFASIGKKPDIVIDDAVNMNIRIVTNADQCLVYDQPPPIGDLTWKMLLD